MSRLIPLILAASTSLVLITSGWAAEPHIMTAVKANDILFREGFEDDDLAGRN